MKRKKLLITGTAGFILGNYIRRFIYLSSKDPEKYPFQVSSIDMVKSNTINAIYNNKNHSFHIANLNDKHIIDSIFQFEKPDVVIHGAANTSLNDQLSSYIDDNITASQNVIDCCKKYGVEKVITFESGKDPSLDGGNYHMTKSVGTQLFRESGLDHITIGLPAVYGPRQDKGKFIPNIIDNIMQEKHIEVASYDLETMHVFDVISGINKILLNGESGIKYYLTNGSVYNTAKIAEMVFDYMNYNKNKLTITYNSPKNTFSLSESSRNSMKSFGWEPRMSMENNLGTDCIQWYINNPWFFK